MPERQLAQWPQWSKLRTTWSPGLTFSTPGPTLSTTPEPSWPRTAGRGTGYHWSRTIRSVWHTPTPTIRTSTSPARGSSTSTSSIEKGRPFSHTTAAVAFMHWLLSQGYPGRTPRSSPAGQRLEPLLHRQAHVVLGERGGGGPRACDVVELGDLHPVLEVVVPLEAVEHRGHPPREPASLPHAPQARLGVAVEKVRRPRRVELRQPSGEDANVGDGEVHALGARRGDDVGGVPGEEEAAVAHGFADEGAHLDDVFPDDPALVHRPPVVGVQPGVHLGPDPVVRPVPRLVVRVALEVEALYLGRARADEGEAALVEGVYELLRRRRPLHEDPEPPERVPPLVFGTDAIGERLARDPVEAVRADDEVAAKLVLLAVLEEPHLRLFGCHVAQLDAPGLEEDLASGVEAGPD